MDAPAHGSCTLIVARPGAADASSDERLLRAVEKELRVPNGSLTPTAGMSRPEFRLIEGVDRPTADRLAGVAAGLGYLPRVRDQLGIRWSNQPRRDGWGPLFLMVATVFVAMASALVGLAGPFTSLLLLVGIVVSTQVALRWRLRQRALPLVLDSRSLIAASSGAGVEEESPVRQAASRARQALAALPDVVAEDRTSDLRSIQRELRAELDQLEAQGELLHQATVACLAALDGQLAWLAKHPDASQESMARIQAAIDTEDEAIQARDLRLHAIVSSIVDIEQGARAAAAELEVEPRARQPAAELQARAAVLRRGELTRNRS